MSKDNGGLLSKVAKFVLHPTTSWGELDQPASVPDWEHTKAMLKEMVERKKRNDFVRNREFDALRKIRRSEAAGTPEAVVKPSYFQSSLMTSPGGRADTLKKIDEIEAQMSMQWWKTKRNEAAGNASAFPDSGANKEAAAAHEKKAAKAAPPSKFKSSGSEQGFAPTAPMSAFAGKSPAFGMPSAFGKPSTFGKDAGKRSAKQPSSSPPSAFAPTALFPPNREGAAPAFGDSIPAMLTPMKLPDAAQAAPEVLESFSASKSFAIEVGEIAHDPELEEAAIRFANGDDAGAESGLLAMLGDTSRAEAEQVEGWLALFDLYRATGQHDRFENAAMDFVNRFQRSAPQWFSMLEVAPAPVAPPPVTGASQLPHWSCPSVVGSQTVAALNGVLGRAKSPWRLDWHKLSAVEDDSVLPDLAKTIESWCAQPVKLSFLGADHLEQFLVERTPSGDNSVNPEWWRLRLAMLRAMGRESEFDDTAVDFCVTYEVSPPSWEKPACVYLTADAEGAGQVAASAAPVPVNDKLELFGVILGDASKALAAFEGRDKTGNSVVVSCGRLARIDFAAAGTLLNWVSVHQAEGRSVQFKEVHRLLAAFFYVIGISEQAKVVLRND